MIKNDIVPLLDQLIVDYLHWKMFLFDLIHIESLHEILILSIDQLYILFHQLNDYIDQVKAKQIIVHFFFLNKNKTLHLQH
jgi:hypothetical protein